MNEFISGVLYGVGLTLVITFGLLILWANRYERKLEDLTRNMMKYLEKK